MIAKRTVLILALAVACRQPGPTSEPSPTANGKSPAAAAEVPAATARTESEVAADEAFGQVLARMGVHFDGEAGTLAVEGRVNMQEGLVEVFACTPLGKTHESVVVLDCVPHGLHAGLLALDLEPGSPVEFGTDGQYHPPTGPGVEIRVHWTGADGEEQVARAEDWIWNQVADGSMEHGAWIFTGSFMQAVTGEPDEATYAANYVKSLVTTYHDASSILENPHPAGVDDTLYYANERIVPAPGTPIRVSFRPAR